MQKMHVPAIFLNGLAGNWGGGGQLPPPCGAGPVHAEVLLPVHLQLSGHNSPDFGQKWDQYYKERSTAGL